MMIQQPQQTCLSILTSRFIVIANKSAGVIWSLVITVNARSNGFIIPALVSNPNRKANGIVMIVQINLKYVTGNDDLTTSYCNTKGFHFPTPLSFTCNKMMT